MGTRRDFPSPGVRALSARLDDILEDASNERNGPARMTLQRVQGTVGDFRQFDSGAQFGAWLGLTPKQCSSGGWSQLGTITKLGSLRDERRRCTDMSDGQRCESP